MLDREGRYQKNLASNLIPIGVEIPCEFSIIDIFGCKTCSVCHLAQTCVANSLYLIIFLMTDEKLWKDMLPPPSGRVQTLCEGAQLILDLES